MPSWTSDNVKRVVRTIVQLTEEQLAALKQLARRRKTSVAAIVREAVDGVLAKEEDERAARVARARALIGTMPSGLGDLARNHDKYFVEDLLHDHRGG